MLPRKKVHNILFFIGIATMIIGLPFSRVLMSISQFILLGNWLLEGDFKRKYHQIKASKLALSLLLFFSIYIVGVLYSSDLTNGLAAVRVKLPLLTLTLVLFTSQLLKKEILRRYLTLFILAVFLSSFVCFLIYLKLFSFQPSDPRNISIFISHIRLSLLIVFSCGLILMKFKKTSSGIHKLILSALFLWFIYFLSILKSFTGLSILGVLILAWLSYLIIRNSKNKWYYLSSIGVLVISILFYGVYQYKSFYDIKPLNETDLNKKTANGSFYQHYLDRNEIENGNYVWINISWKELRISWNERSSLDLFGNDNSGQSVNSTLVRFLSSKGLTKDLVGLAQLSDAEINAIENGVANYRFIEANGLNMRMYKIIWQLHSYIHGNNPQGNSFSQRIEFWKCGWLLFTQNPLVGVGPGDLQVELNQVYNNYSLLDSQYWMKPHNQFLTIGSSSGLFGLIALFGVLFLYFKFSLQQQNILLFMFLLIITISMFTEDTLDTQAGISFFVFFCCFLPGLKDDYQVSIETKSNPISDRE